MIELYLKICAMYLPFVGSLMRMIIIIIYVYVIGGGRLVDYGVGYIARTHLREKF